jgi:thiamine biosynthesis protein ThiS
MSQSKQFILNGEMYRTDNNLTLFDVVTYFNYNDSLLVLEYNNFICEKNKWKTTFLKHSDKIEIVSIVGGG